MPTLTPVALTLLTLAVGTIMTLASCSEPNNNNTGQRLPRVGDEIVVCGQLFHTGTPVVLWMDPGGYDAYRPQNRFSNPPSNAVTTTTQPTFVTRIDPHARAGAPTSAPANTAATRPAQSTSQPARNPATQSSRTSATTQSTKASARSNTLNPPQSGYPERFGLSRLEPSDPRFESLRGGGWDLPTLRSVVDQFVIHFDGCLTSEACFETLHDQRHLSVHFLLDVDGTIYQTLDVKERAWHATLSNPRSVGIEIASVGAVNPQEQAKRFSHYQKRPDGYYLTIAQGRGKVPDGAAYGPLRGPIEGSINGQSFVQMDFTPQQYAALIKLTATLATVLPAIKLDYPRNADGTVITRTLTPDEWAAHKGLLGHFHVQSNKVDPGPAFNWQRVITEARALKRP
jgi:N-acetylmuramoyl-L-alanine amidase